jgi:hypothetical protein
MDFVAGEAAHSYHSMFGEMPVLPHPMSVTRKTVGFDGLDIGIGVVENIGLVESLHVIPARAVTSFTSRNSPAEFK